MLCLQAVAVVKHDVQYTYQKDQRYNDRDHQLHECEAIGLSDVPLAHNVTRWVRQWTAWVCEQRAAVLLF